MFEKEAKFMMWLFFGPALFGGITALLMPRMDLFAASAMCMMVIGSYKVIRSKISEKARTKVPISWGPKDMTNDERRRYRMGYILMVAGIALIPLQVVIVY